LVCCASPAFFPWRLKRMPLERAERAQSRSIPAWAAGERESSLKLRRGASRGLDARAEIECLPGTAVRVARGSLRFRPPPWSRARAAEAVAPHRGRPPTIGLR